MILIDHILISDDLISQKFACHLDKCKGACCYEGDFGAPLETEEIELIHKHLHKLLPRLPEENVKQIEESGFHKYYAEMQEQGTSLLENGACVFMTTNEIGITNCEIESAFNNTDIPFNKPISCHLYPVRAKKSSTNNYEFLNYDQWEICKPACQNGRSLNIPLYQFVKNALIRKYGEEFYIQLNELYQNNIATT